MITNEARSIASVVSLPMRDGNKVQSNTLRMWQRVVSLPMRDGNEKGERGGFGGNWLLAYL